MQYSANIEHTIVFEDKGRKVNNYWCPKMLKALSPEQPRRTIISIHILVYMYICMQCKHMFSMYFFFSLFVDNNSLMVLF